MKHPCGAGKLYVRLNICKDVILTSSDDSGDSTSLPVMLPPTDYRPQACSTSMPRSVAADDEVPSTSSGVSLMDENISSLTVLFPEAKLSEIRDTLIQCGSLELAAEKLSEKADSACTCVQSDTCMDASRILKQLKLKMKGYGLAERIKVDREDLILDLFQYSGLLIFRGKKSKISRNFQGQIRGKIGRFRGKKVKIRGKIGPFRVILAEKSQFSKDFQGQIIS